MALSFACHRWGRMNLYWSAGEPILVAVVTYIGRHPNLYRFAR
ncbi:hypothetical protein HMPREF3185_00956 [Porphyromonas somerae]|uniref:Uncharacterized protein n=1 Tax=Porphyromonas somerae TaxID=322095 RepID=A0A134B8V8_9PORP|nr:hypothetical protein HMPREF3184_00956 [Porphyromonadaceae bacterium KA00676]KXB76381.1 hypothetical protein HMPREF3185_00956 [Porphyromonas somerae]